MGPCEPAKPVLNLAQGGLAHRCKHAGQVVGVWCKTRCVFGHAPEVEPCQVSSVCAAQWCLSLSLFTIDSDVVIMYSGTLGHTPKGPFISHTHYMHMALPHFQCLLCGLIGIITC